MWSPTRSNKRESLMGRSTEMSDLLTRIESTEMRKVMLVGITEREGELCHASIGAADTTPPKVASACSVGDDDERRQDAPTLGFSIIER